MAFPPSSPLLSWVTHWQSRGVSPIPAAFRLHRVDCVPSTNAHLWDWVDATQAEMNPRCGTALIAHRQSAGRGQWGRQWHSPLGGLYLSATLPVVEGCHGGQIMLSCAWGVATALQQFGVQTKLKWPNDLVIGSQKLGGMLLETRISGTSIARAAIGVGINWRNAAPSGGISIAQLKNSPACAPLQASIETLAAAVLTGIAVGNGRRFYQDIAEILPDYEAQMTHLGQTVTIDYQGTRSQGRIEGIAATGQLRITVSQPAVGQAEFSNTIRPHLPLEIAADVGSVHLGYDTIGHGAANHDAIGKLSQSTT